MSVEPVLFGERVPVRALHVGDRLDTAGLEHSGVLSTTPLAFQLGGGIAVLFRYGVVVLFALTPLEEDEILRSLQSRVIGATAKPEQEAATVQISAEQDDQIPAGGPIYVCALTLERILLISDALAKSVVLAHDEGAVEEVFEQIEPFARRLADRGRTPVGRRTILKHIGNALMVQYRVSGRVAVAEKPDALWDRPNLERLYSRLDDEYELSERAEVLNRKLAVIAETAKALTDIIDTERSLRLERIIVVLILFEIAITAWQILER